MATIFESLRAINAYPIPERAINNACVKRGVDPNVEATYQVVTGEAYNLARADLLIWLSAAPTISQGGQSFSFSEYERKKLREEGLGIIEEYEADERKPVYGYKGSRL